MRRKLADTAPSPPLADRGAASPSPVTEAGLRLEGTVVVAAAQTAALVAAQRRNQVDGTWKTHTRRRQSTDS